MEAGRDRALTLWKGMQMVQMTIEIPEEALGALRKEPQDFARELRLAAAVKW